MARGSSGQFDVFVDSQLIASRQGNILVRMLGGGWPDENDVVAEIDKRRPKAAT